MSTTIEIVDGKWKPLKTSKKNCKSTTNCREVKFFVKRRWWQWFSPPHHHSTSMQLKSRHFPCAFIIKLLRTLKGKKGCFWWMQKWCYCMVICGMFLRTAAVMVIERRWKREKSRKSDDFMAWDEFASKSAASVIFVKKIWNSWHTKRI